MKSIRERLPLFNAGQLGYIRSEGDFARLRRVNAAAQQLRAQRDAVAREFLRILPADYKLIPYDLDRVDGELFAVQDGAGNDVGYPLTLSEAHDRAWRHANVEAPRVDDFPAYAKLTAEIRAVEEQGQTASRQIDAEFATAAEIFRRRVDT